MKETISMLGYNAEMHDTFMVHSLHLYYDLVVYDDNPEMVPGSVRPAYAGGWTDFFAAHHDKPVPKIILGVASSAAARRRAIERIHCVPVCPITLIDPTAVIGHGASIGVGAFVGPLSYIGPRATLYALSCILPGGKLYHDAMLGTGSIIVGNAAVLGRAKIGDHTWVCGGATVLPDAVIGSDSIVPARGLVRRVIED